MAVEDQEWRLYEEQIYETLKEAGGPDAEVIFDKKIKGRFSGVDRQVDVWVKGKYLEGVEEDVTAAVDCKYYKRNVDVKGVESFIGQVEDVNTDLGFLITTQGFSKGAEARVKNGTRGIRLKKMPALFLARMDQFPSVSVSDLAEPYYEGSYWDSEPYGGAGAVVRFHYVPDYGYSFDPDQGLEWSEETLATGAGDEVSWGENAARAEIARVVLEHHLGEKPSDDAVEAFMEEIASHWEDGQEWVITPSEIKEETGY